MKYLGSQSIYRGKDTVFDDGTFIYYRRRIAKQLRQQMPYKLALGVTDYYTSLAVTINAIDIFVSIECQLIIDKMH